MADSAEDFDFVSLDSHARSPPEPEPAPGKLVTDCPRLHLESGR